MKNKKNGIRYCSICRSKLYKNGFDKNGKQRWYCKNCAMSFNLGKKIKLKNEVIKKIPNRKA